MTSRDEDTGMRQPDAAERPNLKQPGEPAEADRRVAPRYAGGARALIHRKRGGPVPATVVNISTSGMLLNLDQPTGFQLDETVTVEIQEPLNPEQAFSCWGIGIVVRLEPGRSAIHLRAGTFHGDSPKGGEHCPHSPASNPKKP